jgi:uncharacterized protein YgbK (DUF1537 family)
MGRDARLFVKIDSTLRGPIAALIEGALDGSRFGRAKVAPAFPEQGREVVRGELRVAGQAPGPMVREVLGSVGARCSVHDSSELATVAGATDALLVGSSGLARRIAGPPVARRPIARAASALVVAGSPAQTTRRQLERLPHTMDVSAPPKRNRDRGQAATELAERLGVGDKPELLVVTGGQTARLVCARLRATGVALLGEVQPGLPFGRLHGGSWDGVLLVTKAGGFGGPNALLDALRLLGPSSLDRS